MNVDEIRAEAQRRWEKKKMNGEHGEPPDWHFDEGAEARAAKPDRYQFLSADDLLLRPRAKWLVKGVIPSRGVSSIYGPSTSGKTFLALDLAASVALGLDWFGYRVEQAPVLYVALEGAWGLPSRINAMLHKYEGAPIKFLMEPFRLNNRRDVIDLMAAIEQRIGAGSMIFIDTLNRAIPGADENSAKDAGIILEACAELQQKTDGLVMLVAHPGKDATKGMRGHSSIFANMDGAIVVSRPNTGPRDWTTHKVKDGPDDKCHAFHLRVVELGTDDDGDPVTSCVIEPTESAPTKRKQSFGGNQRAVYDALLPLFTAGELGKPGAPPYRPSINLEVAVHAGAARLTCEQKRRPERARAAIAGLVARGEIGIHQGVIWLA